MKQLVKNACRIMALTTTCLVYSFTSYAQETQTEMESSTSAKYGIKGGVNFTNLYVDDVDDENAKVGFNAGFFAKLPVAGWFSVQPEVIYSSKGSKISYNNPLLGTGEYRYNLGYVEVPVLGVFNVTENLSLHAGVYGAYLVNSDIEDVDDNGTVTQIADLDEDSFERFDFGLAGGVGFDIDNFSLGIRYNYGLREIGKEGNFSNTVLQNSKNSAFSVYVALGF